MEDECLIKFIINQANQWCAQGIEILAQPMEKCSNPEQAEEALVQLEAFKTAGVKWGASDSAELKTTFQDVITPETKALVQQVSKTEPQLYTLFNFFLFGIF